MFATIHGSMSRMLSRRLLDISRSASDSLQRLSTGRRIVRFGDDVLGSITEKRIDSQIRGLSQSAININKARGITETADLALEKLSLLTEQLLEKAADAANGDTTLAERTSLSDEATELLREFSEVSKFTQFGEFSLLDGSLNNYFVQTGTSANQGFAFSIADARASTLGRIARTQSLGSNILDNAIGSSGYDLAINGIEIAPAQSDGVSSADDKRSALAAARTINLKSNETGVKARALATTLTLEVNSTWDATTQVDGDEILINGVSIDTTGVSGGTVIDNVVTLRDQINDISANTGVVASIDVNGDILLTAEDGRNIEVDIFSEFIGTNALLTDNIFVVGTLTNKVNTGAIELVSSKAFVITGTNTTNSIGIKEGTYFIDRTTSTSSVRLNTQENALKALSVLESTLESINQIRAQVGAVHSRLEINEAFVLDQQANFESMQERISGADIALETTNVSVQQMLQDAALAALTQANVSYSAASRLLLDNLPAR
ncbi:MAG: flagellin [Bdellovibrionota bacterium]